MHIILIKIFNCYSFVPSHDLRHSSPKGPVPETKQGVHSFIGTAIHPILGPCGRQTFVKKHLLHGPNNMFKKVLPPHSVILSICFHRLCLERTRPARRHPCHSVRRPRRQPLRPWFPSTRLDDVDSSRLNVSYAGLKGPVTLTFGLDWGITYTQEGWLVRYQVGFATDQENSL